MEEEDSSRKGWWTGGDGVKKPRRRGLEVRKMKFLRVMLVMIEMGLYGVVLGMVMVGIVSFVGVIICFVMHLLGL